jgi:DNA-binding MarR family transcriptional regulator
LEEQELSEQLAAIERLMLRVAWVELRRFAQETGTLGITVPQFLVLRSILTRERQPTMSALAGDTLQRFATMTGIVGRLEKLGLVSRQRDERDRRRVLVELTAAGRRLLRKVRRSRQERVRETLGHLPAQDGQELLRLLRLYLEAFELGSKEAEAEPSEVGTSTE